MLHMPESGGGGGGGRTAPTIKLLKYIVCTFYLDSTFHMI